MSWLNRLSWTASLILSFLLLSSCQDIVEKQCNQVCDIFVSCTEKALKQTFSPEIRKQGRISCLDGCTTHNSEILQCYEQVGDSCTGFANCLQQLESLE